MLDKQNTITTEELRTYLYSLNEEKTEEEENQINIYKEECEKKQKEAKSKDIEWIRKVIDEEYQRRNQTKDKILDLLEECSNIPKNIERLEISRYMLYRVDIIRAEKILENVMKRFSKRYKKVLREILELIEIYPVLDFVKEIDSSEYNIDSSKLDKAKKKFIEEYSDKQKMKLIQKELDIIEKTKIFNSTPIPHEILKSSDRDIQLKMPKFNTMRRKRINILSTMEADYLKLIEPREINEMIDDALASIESISDILTKSEYRRIKNKLIRRRRKIYRSTSEIRSIIKSKEKRTGIINYNLQEARYERMEKLRQQILEATKIIDVNDVSKLEANMKKLEQTYEKEKRYALVIEDINNKGNTNAEVALLEEQMKSLKNRIQNSKKIIEEQKNRIADIKRELIILWKVEIDNTISNKKEDFLELAEGNDERNEFSTEKKAILGLSKLKKAKSELV